MEISQKEYSQMIYEFYKLAIIEFAKQNEIGDISVFYNGVDAAKSSVDCYLEKMNIKVVATIDNNSDDQIRKIAKEEIHKFEKEILIQLGRGGIQSSASMSR